MIVNTVEKYNEDLRSLIEGFRERIQGGNTIFPPCLNVYCMDKPIKIYTANVDDYTGALMDKGEYYEMMFPRFGELQKCYKNNFSWIVDDDTLLITERPFKNRVIKLLRRLLPNNCVHVIKNDVMIDNFKVGPTCMIGKITDWYCENENPPTSSILYCLRWRNVEALDEIFKGDPNHELRKNGKMPLNSLDKFLNISKEEFIKLLQELE